MNDETHGGIHRVAEWRQLDRQFRYFQLLFVAIKAGISDVLKEGPRTLDAICDATKIAAPRLYRLLRGLIWCEMLDTDDAGAYFLTPAGKALLDDAPGSLAAGIRFQGEFFFNAWGHLWDYLTTGAAPFPLAHGGATLFEKLESDANLAALFSAPMTWRSGELSAKVAEHPVFAVCSGSAVIVDVGGGAGRLLSDILEAHPGTKGILLELPILEDAATTLIAAEGLAERCRFVPGDMFAAVPTGADIYFLKWVLHDWNDEDAVRILRRCASAMQASGGNAARLLIVERLMPEVVGASNTGLVQADLNMLCQMNGAERTRAEYENLLSAADLHILSVRQLNDPLDFAILECGRA